MILQVAEYCAEKITMQMPLKIHSVPRMTSVTKCRERMSPQGYLMRYVNSDDEKNLVSLLWHQILASIIRENFTTIEISTIQELAQVISA